MLRKRNKTVIYGLYNDETDLLTAVNKANSKHLDIFDVYSPFPIHGLDPLLGLAESEASHRRIYLWSIRYNDSFWWNDMDIY